MLVTRANILNGKINHMELSVTKEGLSRWQNGELIQNVFPNLSPEEREFLITGILPEDQDLYFEEPEEWGDDENSSI